MKKIIGIALSFLISVSALPLYAQTFRSAEIGEEIYTVLENAALYGLCSPLSTSKPYSRKYINQKLDEIIENAGDDSSQKEIAEYYKSKYSDVKEGFDWRTLSFRVTGGSEKVPVSFNASIDVDFVMHGGLYNKSSKNCFGYEESNYFRFYGDIGRNFSYYAHAYVGLLKLPLEKIDTADPYVIGQWWDSSSASYPAGKNRIINTYRNNWSRPYGYSKIFGNSLFYLSKVDNSGQEDWPFQNAFSYGMDVEFRGDFLEEHFKYNIGRHRRDVASMDEGASLVLNANARPYFGFDLEVTPFKWISVYVTAGNLEFPNQDYITRTSEDGTNVKAWDDDNKHFQNMFALGQFNLDFKYAHWDFGSSVVYPKRPELAYSFPILDRIVYQDNVGDFDNLALYTNLKLRKPGLGFIWGSFYLDEVDGFKFSASHWFHNTRSMFAVQGGIKAIIPQKALKLATVSFRYTKIEPYCYTHQALDKIPYYHGQYMSEAYMNNGTSLGYYLPPNTDEFLIQFDAKPTTCSNLRFVTALTRHGADYGSQQVPGSSLYSEMQPSGRNDLKKYFLKDGAYEWNLILQIGGSYDFRPKGVPVTVYGSIGYLNTWWSLLDNYTADHKAGKGSEGSYSFKETAEYEWKQGVIVSFGIKVFGK